MRRPGHGGSWCPPPVGGDKALCLSPHCLLQFFKTPNCPLVLKQPPECCQSQATPPDTASRSWSGAHQTTRDDYKGLEEQQHRRSLSTLLLIGMAAA